MDTMSRTIATRDGRELRIIEAGSLNGFPILVHNGTPTGRLLYPPCVKDAEARGIHLISYERPGYGASTPQPGRTVASAAYDIAAIAEALSLRRLAVWGISGGGPHALACAALLPDLVVAAAALASPAPFQAEGLDWFAGMNEGGVMEFRAALGGRQTMEQFVEAATPGLLNSTPATFAQAFGSALNPPDTAALTEDLARYLLDCFYEGIHQRRDGWIDDDLAFVNEWGFEPSQIQVPVMLVQGVQDDVVPLPHGQWLANTIPNVNVQFLPEDGHITLLAHRIPGVHYG